jgi:flagellar biogenesis protein FliO
MNPALCILAAAALASAAAPAKSLYSAPSHAERSEAAAAEDLPPPPPSPAMEEKFRKLQKEMERKEPSARQGAGAESGKPRETPAPEATGIGSIALQVAFGLAFVLLLAVVSIRGLKRMQGRLLSKPGRGGDLLEVLETCHLGAHQKVVAIRMNDEVGVLGVTQQGISLLTLLKDPVDEIRRTRGGESNSAAFSDNLNKLLERFKKPKKVSDLLDEGAA